MQRLVSFFVVALVAAVLAAAAPADAAIIRAQTGEGAVKRLLAANDYDAPRHVDCARVTRRRWSCDWRASLAGEFACSGVARVTRSLSSRTRWVVSARVTGGDSLCYP